MPLQGIPCKLLSPERIWVVIDIGRHVNPGVATVFRA